MMKVKADQNRREQARLSQPSKPKGGRLLKKIHTFNQNILILDVSNILALQLSTYPFQHFRTFIQVICNFHKEHISGFCL